MGEPARIHELVTGAGFGEPDLVQIPVMFRWPDFDDLWDSLVRSRDRSRGRSRSCPRKSRKATRSAIEDSTTSFRLDDRSYEVPGVTWGVLAR
jgi:hypothetical protein